MRIGRRNRATRDPKAYTKPWTVTLNEVFQPDTELLDYHCMDVYLHDAERR